MTGDGEELKGLLEDVQLEALQAVFECAARLIELEAEAEEYRLALGELQANRRP